MKFELIVVYETSLEEFDINMSNYGEGHSGTLIVLHSPQNQLSSPISQLRHMVGSCDHHCLLMVPS